MAFFSKISSVFGLACDFKSILFDRLKNPLQTKRIAEFLFGVKKVFESKDNKVEASFEALDLFVELKKNYPDDYQEILVIINDILKKYEEDPIKIQQRIKEFLGEE